MKTIPSLLRQGDKVKAVIGTIDAKFKSLPSPAYVSPNASPGEVISAISQGSPDYHKSIADIWDESLEPVKSFDTDCREVDEYGAFLVRCTDHMMTGSDIGKSLDRQVSDWARTVWKAKQAQIINPQDVTHTGERCRSDIESEMSKLQDSASYAKKYRRTVKNALLMNTTNLLNAVLKTKGLAINDAQRSRLKALQKRTEGKRELFNAIYKNMYYGKRKHTAPRAVRLKTLEVLRGY